MPFERRVSRAKLEGEGSGIRQAQRRRLGSWNSRRAGPSGLKLVGRPEVAWAARD